ncbi:hypothetical protein GQX74_000202 [Glossina fuscipes]|nr:hypothetical protein GQX74_000202 [Glossina fuscipes]
MALPGVTHMYCISSICFVIENKQHCDNDDDDNDDDDDYDDNSRAHKYNKCKTLMIMLANKPTSTPLTMQTTKHTSHTIKSRLESCHRRQGNLKSSKVNREHINMAAKVASDIFVNMPIIGITKTPTFNSVKIRQNVYVSSGVSTMNCGSVTLGYNKKTIKSWFFIASNYNFLWHFHIITIHKWFYKN